MTSLAPEVEARLLALYAEVDAQIAAAKPRCDASGRCCRFREYGHTLFISMIEATHLLKSAPGYIQPVSGDFCPFQEGNLCTAREPRPLGCRIYFCDPNYEGVGEAITEAALKKLKQLSDEFNLDWRYAPLHWFLNEASPRPIIDASPRIPLTLTPPENST